MNHILRTSATLACLFATTCFATETKVETVAEELAPSALAIRPGGTADKFDIYVAETRAGKIFRISSDKLADRFEAITGFQAATGDDYLHGPSALYFLDRDHLVVGCLDQPAVRMYELTSELTSQLAEAHKQVVENEEVGQALAFARTRDNDKVPDMLIVAVRGRDWRLGLGKIPVRAGTLDRITRLIPRSSSGDPAKDVAVNPQGFVVVCRVDSSAQPNRSLITFIDPITGAERLNLPVELPVLNALAYSPMGEKLYVADFGSDDDPGGVYRIDDASQPERPACKAVKIAAIDHPTHLAFAPDGTLYVTTADYPQEAATPHGKLLRITGEL